MSSIVRSGFRPHSDKLAAALTIESLRMQHEEMARKYSKLRGAVLDWLDSRGLENEPAYLVRVEREVGRRR